MELEDADEEEIEPYPAVQAQLARLGLDTQTLKKKVFQLIQETDDLDMQVANVISEAVQIHEEVTDEVADLGK